MPNYAMLFGMSPHGFRTPHAPGAAGPFSPALALVLDAILSETIHMEAQLTKSPIETGEDVTDHAILVPDRLTIEALVSNTPLGYLALGSPFANPAKKALDFLTRVFTDRIPFDFVGGFKVYQNMVMTRFTPDRTSSTGDALRFTAEMERILLATAQLVPVGNVDPAVQGTAAAQKDAGNQPAAAASAKASNNTIAYDMEHKGIIAGLFSHFGVQ